MFALARDNGGDTKLHDARFFSFVGVKLSEARLPIAMTIPSTLGPT